MIKLGSLALLVRTVVTLVADIAVFVYFNAFVILYAVVAEGMQKRLDSTLYLTLTVGIFDSPPL